MNIPRIEIQPLHRLVVPRVRTRRRVEEQQDGSSLQLQLSITNNRQPGFSQSLKILKRNLTD